MDINEVIIAHLRALPQTFDRVRRERGHTYHDVAFRTGLSTSQIHRLVNDLNYNPSQTTIQTILLYLTEA